jgi:hypothetical protein
MIYQGRPSARLSRISDVARPLDVFDLLLVPADTHLLHICTQ